MCDYCKQIEIVCKDLIYWPLIHKHSCKSCFEIARQEALQVIATEGDMYVPKPV